MKIVAWLYRAHVLAVIFAAYFAFTLIAAWILASRLSTSWFGPEISRWVYTTYILASATFLTGAGVLGFAIQSSFERRVSEVNRELGTLLLDGGTGLSPEEILLPNPEDPSADDSKGEDLVALLETLGEVQNQDVLMVPPKATSKEALAAHRLQLALLDQREQLRRHERVLAKFLPGPTVMAVIILGFSAAMLPAADGMLQAFHPLNTTLILGFAYAWIGLAAYFAVSVLGIIVALGKAPKQSSG